MREIKRKTWNVLKVVKNFVFNYIANLFVMILISIVSVVFLLTMLSPEFSEKIFPKWFSIKNPFFLIWFYLISNLYYLFISIVLNYLFVPINPKEFWSGSFLGLTRPVRK